VRARRANCGAVGCCGGSGKWVCALGNDGRVYFKAELDFALTKGLAVLQVKGLSGAKPCGDSQGLPRFVQKLDR
jgi:hypothetical protein